MIWHQVHGARRAHAVALRRAPTQVAGVRLQLAVARLGFLQKPRRRKVDGKHGARHGVAVVLQNALVQHQGLQPGHVGRGDVNGGGHVRHGGRDVHDFGYRCVAGAEHAADKVEHRQGQRPGADNGVRDSGGRSAHVQQAYVVLRASARKRGGVVDARQHQLDDAVDLGDPKVHRAAQEHPQRLHVKSFEHARVRQSQQHLQQRNGHVDGVVDGLFCSRLRHDSRDVSQHGRQRRAATGRRRRQRGHGLVNQLFNAGRHVQMPHVHRVLEIVRAVLALSRRQPRRPLAQQCGKSAHGRKQQRHDDLFAVHGPTVHDAADQLRHGVGQNKRHGVRDGHDGLVHDAPHPQDDLNDHHEKVAHAGVHCVQRLQDVRRAVGDGNGVIDRAQEYHDQRQQRLVKHDARGGLRGVLDGRRHCIQQYGRALQVSGPRKFVRVHHGHNDARDHNGRGGAADHAGNKHQSCHAQCVASPGSSLADSVHHTFIGLARICS
ncbi:MAG: hypothetical protein CMM87_05740 [Rickettsiales bacterium]|nr:hypothetical protein [Rickettsiales bacterium]